MSEHRGPTAPTATRRNDVLFRPALGGLDTSDGTVKLGLGSVPVVPPGPSPSLPAAWPARGSATASAGDGRGFPSPGSAAPRPPGQGHGPGATIREIHGLTESPSNLLAGSGGSGAGRAVSLPLLTAVRPHRRLTGRANLFRIESSSCRAPLRNRTVDLLLTMQASFVRWHRLGSDYRRSEGSRYLSTSRSVCRRLGS